MDAMEGLLKEKIHKDQGLSTAQRTYYILTDLKGAEMTRTAKFVSLLAAQLVSDSRLSETELDNILLQLV
jgi:hypothetical protein